MKALKGMIRKKKEEKKWKKVGEGKRLGDAPEEPQATTQVPIGSRPGEAPPREPRQMTEAQQRAAEQAAARQTGQGKGKGKGKPSAAAQEAAAREAARVREEREAADAAAAARTEPPADTDASELRALLDMVDAESRDRLETAVDVMLQAVADAQPTLQLLNTVLFNCLSNPHDRKYRTLKMANGKLKATIFDVPGGQLFLEAAGWVPMHDEDAGGDVLTLPFFDGDAPLAAAGMDVLGTRLAAKMRTSTGVPMTAAVAARRQQQAVPPTTDRCLRVFSPPAASGGAASFDPGRFDELPDDFYQLTREEVAADLKARQKAREDGQVLKTRAVRDMEAARRRRRYAKTVIRVRFPDQSVVQAFFSPRETTATLLEFVASLLVMPLPFLLTTGVLKETLEPSQQTLAAAGLVPAALLNFKWDDQTAPRDVYLSDAASAAMEPMEGSHVYTR